jgi:hypothetical protein
VPPILTDSGIGALRIHQPIAAVMARCEVIADFVTDGNHEEGVNRVLRVAIGRDTVSAIVEAEAIASIELDTPGIRTRDSLGVGAPAGRVIELQDVTGSHFEGMYYARSPRHCGLVFGFRSLGGAQADSEGEVLGAPALRMAAGAAVIELVRVRACTNDLP